MKAFKDLNSLEKKARISEGRINCGECPMFRKCTDEMHEACSYIYQTAYIRGYRQHKKEISCKKKKS